MCKHMTSIAEDKNMLGPEQFGFRKGRSTSDAIFLLSTLLTKAKAKSLPFSAAFLDVSKVQALK